MIFLLENFERLVESSSFFLARMEMWHPIYTFKGPNIIHLLQIHVVTRGAWPGISESRQSQE